MNEWVLSPNKFLTKDEVAALLRKAEECRSAGVARGQRQPVKDWVLVRLALLSGLRASELADLRVVDCHVGYGHSDLFVRRGKNGKPRVVKISPDLKRDIRWFLRWKSEHGELHPEAFLIKGHRKERVSRIALWKRWKKMCPAHRLHDSRHTHATMLLEATRNLRLVQKQLGHSSPAITAVYADVVDSEAREGLVAMDQLVRRAGAKGEQRLVDDNLPSSPGRITGIAIR